MVDVRDTAPDGPPTRAEPRPPVVAASEIEITATPEVVWAVLTEFGRWPSWNPEVTSMSMDAPLDRSLENGLRHLKVEAEQRAAAGGQ